MPFVIDIRLDKQRHDSQATVDLPPNLLDRYTKSSQLKGRAIALLVSSLYPVSCSHNGCATGNVPITRLVMRVLDLVDPSRPVIDVPHERAFATGNGPNDYLSGGCGNILFAQLDLPNPPKVTMVVRQVPNAERHDRHRNDVSFARG